MVRISGISGIFQQCRLTVTQAPPRPDTLAPTQPGYSCCRGEKVEKYLFLGDLERDVERHWPSTQEEKIRIPAMQERVKYTRHSLEYQRSHNSQCNV